MKCIAVISLALAATSTWAESTEQFDFFEEKIRPLLAMHCYECHSEKKQKGGLRLDSRGAVLRGGESGPAIVLGRPAESLLIEAVSYQSSDLQMPPKRELGKRQVADLKRWVAMGAPWPGMEGKESEEQLDKVFEISEEISNR